MPGHAVIVILVSISVTLHLVSEAPGRTSCRAICNVSLVSHIEYVTLVGHSDSSGRGPTRMLNNGGCLRGE